MRQQAAAGIVLGVAAVAQPAGAEPSTAVRSGSESRAHEDCSKDGCDWLQLSAGYVGPGLGTQVSLEGYRGESVQSLGMSRMWAGGIGVWESQDSYGIDILSNCFGLAVVKPGVTYRFGAGYVGIIYDRVDGQDAFGILTPLASGGAELHLGRARIGLVLTGRYRWHFSGDHLPQLMLSVTSRFDPT